MILNGVAFIILIVGLAVLIAIIARRLPEISAIDPRGFDDTARGDVKRTLLEKRLVRRLRALGQMIGRHGQPIVQVSSTIVQRVHQVEEALRARRSHLLQRRSEKASHAIGEHMRRAQEAYDQEQFDNAERELIEIVRINPRYVEAYRMLGSIYQQRHEYPHAREVFTLVERLGGKNLELSVIFADLARSEDKPKEALHHYQDALTFEPRNPKLLDAALEVALAAGDATVARDLLERLRMANPDNEKIVALETQVAELSK